MSPRRAIVSLGIGLALLVGVASHGWSQTVGNGDGLSGSYFDNRHLSETPVAQRVEAQVDFDWGLGAPPGLSHPDEFSARWTGELQAQHSEPYTIYVDSDDGSRVWLNEQLIIDNWVDAPAPEASATVNLVAGQKYLLRVEYYQNCLFAGIRLQWSSPSTPKQTIPQSQLYSAPTDADHNGLADIWELAHFGRMGVDPNGDDDGDGLTNLEEYWRWSDPRVPLHWGVPNNWMHGNMGSAVGDASYSNGVFTVTSTGGAGTNALGGGRDAFHFLYQPLEGNGQVVARVLRMSGVGGVGSPAKVGVMVRLTLRDNSPYAVLLGFGTNGLVFQKRGDSTSSYLSAPDAPNGPFWIKAVRWSEPSGYDSIAGYTSADGTNWVRADWLAMPEGSRLPRRVYVGLVVASPQPDALVTVQLDQASVSPVTLADVQAGTPVMGTGDGLTGGYYANTNFAGTPVMTRVDRLVNFDWGRGAPGDAMPNDLFSVAWSGELQAQYTEPYTIYFRADDGVRLWLDGRLIKWVVGINESSATVNLTAGQRYLLNVDYYENHGAAQARLGWSSPSTPKRIVPQSQLYSQFTDTDSDGLPDIWERLYFGDLRYGPNDDPDGDGLTNLQEYRHHTNPNQADTDGDGLPDGWEVAHGLNPLDPTDAARDNDYDGLTNLEEYQRGTDPNMADTDGDGVPDGVEVKYAHTDPLAADPGLVTEVMRVNGAQGTNFLGRWAVEGNDLVALDRRGSVDFVLSNVGTNKYLLQVEGAQDEPRSSVPALELMVSLDGENLGRQLLYGGYGTNGMAEYVTPFMKRGKHTVSVFWEGAANLSRLRLKQVRLERIGGPDSDGDGITDWVAAMLKAESGLDTNAPLSSYVSPLCLEGRDPYLSLMSLKVETDSGQTEWPIQRNAGKRWYANVPLQTNGNTTVRISYQNRAVVERHLPTWEPLNVLTMATGSVPALTIRKDDSVLFTARPAGRPHGNVSIAIADGLQSVAQYATTTRNPAPFQFTNAGDYTVSATYSPTNRGAPAAGGITIKVIDYGFPDRPVCWAGRVRDWALTNVPAQLVLESDPRVQLTAETNAPAGVRALSLLTDQNEPRTIVARLEPNGPIAAAVRADSLRLFGAPDTYNKLIERYPDGSRLVETMVILSPVFTNVTVQLSVIVGGVTLDDGTTSRCLTPSDFDALGQRTVRFLMPAGVQTANCHRLVVMQGPVPIGRY